MKVGLVLAFLFSNFAGAAELPSPQVSTVEIEKARKRLYPGGRDEEDLKVQATLPEALAKTSVRVIQKEVHKKLFDEELKDDGPTDAEVEH